MRDLLVFSVVVLSLPLALRRPYAGLLLFSWLAYMRPQDLCWSFARHMRFSFLAGVAMIVGWAAYELGRRRFTHWDLRTGLMALLLGLMSVSLILAVEKDSYVMRYYVEYIKIIVVALFTVGQVDTRQRLRWLLWLICGCLAFYGVKGGLFGVLTGGSMILRGPGGMLEDNNDFALALVMNVPLLFYLSRSEGKAWLRRACNVAVLLTMVTILLTHSRGAFLALTATVLAIAWRSGRLFQAVGGLAALVILFFAFAPQHVVDRIASIGQGGAEASAGARLRAWTIALRMIGANPVLGVGLRNFREHWDRHAWGFDTSGDFAYVAHNSYLQIWAEGGTIAFAAYLLMLASVFWACRRLRHWGRLRPDLAWAGQYGRMMEATAVGFMVGAFFLDRGHFDLIYHFVAIVSCMLLVARSEVLTAGQPTSEVRPPGVRVRRRPALAAAGHGRWERAT